MDQIDLSSIIYSFAIGKILLDVSINFKKKKISCFQLIKGRTLGCSTELASLCSLFDTADN